MRSKRMKYFVTGATGFVGNVLARKLRDAGHEVNASVRSPEKGNELQAIGVKLFKGDVTDKESIREPMTGVDGVYHVAGWYKIGTKDKSDGERVNIQGTRNVLELMQELKIPKGVYTSTLAINSDTKGRVVGESYIIAGEPCTFLDAFKLASQVSGKKAPNAAPYQIMKLFSILVKPFDSLMPDSYTSEGLRIVAGATYLGNNSKAKRELGYNPRPVSEGWTETVRHEMKLLGIN